MSCPDELASYPASLFLKEVLQFSVDKERLYLVLREDCVRVERAEKICAIGLQLGSLVAAGHEKRQWGRFRYLLFSSIKFFKLFATEITDFSILPKHLETVHIRFFCDSSCGPDLRDDCHGVLADVVP